MASQYANTQDAVSANRAECFVTLDGRRYSMMMAKEFEGKASIGSKEVYMLGNPVVGHKAQTVNLKFSMTIYKCTEIFDDVVEEFLRTGVMPTFDIQTTNDDPASSAGRSTRIYTDCVLDGKPSRATATALPDRSSSAIRPICKKERDDLL